MDAVARLDSPTPARHTPDGCPKYLSLAKNFERQMRAGVLRVGDRLPSIRQLRDAHRVSAATAVGCYLWLERQGYVRARPKSGYFVSRAPLSDGLVPEVAPKTRGPVAVKVGGMGADPAVRPGRTDAINLGPAVIGPALLPHKRLNRSVRLALSAFADHAASFEDPRGNVRLRRQVARLVFRQGASCSADDILVTSGSTEATNLALRAVTRPGDVVAVESPSCYETLQVLEALHLRAVEIPHVTHAGIDLDKLAAVATRHRVAAILTIGTCHNPFGDIATDESKAQVVGFAARHDIPVVEGDTFGDLVYTAPRPRTLKSFDTAGIVLQCSSLAHYVAPGFNLGWMNGGRWHERVLHLKSITNVAGARLPQLAMAEFLESGGFDTHLRELRVTLWRSVEAAREEVLRSFPEGTRVTRPEGGFVLWVQLPARYDGVEVAARAAEAGITILPGAVFSATHQYRNCIRIACGHPAETLVPAVRRLGSLLATASLPAAPVD
jgi:DNA-binding transcriptional MocR family regulator